ncbi:hypothetical protein CXB41_08435 [Pseudomonas syringae pv. syringae]|nr:hypothetical protein CXB41_08435 [Pseudomonas syringae pv. syringae]
MRVAGAPPIACSKPLVGASLLAKTMYQRRTVFEACTGPFASKLAPTVSACGRRSADCMQ